MAAAIHPIYLQRKSERNSANRAVRNAGPTPRRKSRPEGTDTCTCGHVVTAPYSSNYSPKALINKWHCSACGARWRTTADLWHP